MNREVNDGVVGSSDALGEWERRAWTIGVEVAGPNADDVDRAARHPHEAVSAMREARLLSAILPEDLGGGGASIAELVGAVRALATHCASSALVLAMHSIEAFNLARHGKTSQLNEFTREVANEQLLLANANSEVGVGGDVGRSICALGSNGDPWRLEKQALAISYGEYADAVLTMARRSPDAAETDQVYVVIRRTDFTLEPLSDWDTLGLRGTCSRGYLLKAKVDPGLVFPTPFATIANDGAGQVRQLFLSAVWVGIAEGALSRAHSFVRVAARRVIGAVPPGARRVSEMAGQVQAGRSLLVTSALRLSTLLDTGDLENQGFTIALRNLKVTTSTLGVNIAKEALEVCGIMGYKRDTPYSLDRIIRDAHGGLIMVSNDRYLHDNAQLLLISKKI